MCVKDRLRDDWIDKVDSLVGWNGIPFAKGPLLLYIDVWPRKPPQKQYVKIGKKYQGGGSGDLAALVPVSRLRVSKAPFAPPPSIRYRPSLSLTSSQNAVLERFIKKIQLGRLIVLRWLCAFFLSFFSSIRQHEAMCRFLELLTCCGLEVAPQALHAVLDLRRRLRRL